MGQDIRELSFIVVEDNEFQRSISIKILEAMGSPLVLGAEDGQDALEKLVACEKPVDIAVSDLDMPGMDGVEFIRHLSCQGLCEAVVIASGMDEALVRTVEELAGEHGLIVLGHIAKPLNKDKINTMLNTYMARKKQRYPDTYSSEITLDDVKAALYEKQFKVWYQPKVEFKNGNWSAVEALARWEHPVMGMVSPDRFIPLLEKENLVHELTWQQMHILIKDIQQWIKRGKKIVVSTNLSSTMLDDVTLPEKLTEIIQYHKVPPANIVLEITESVVIQNMAKSLETIARLKLKGFSLSIDDFGTGYSSLKQLSRIPFSELKIDQSFVKNAPSNNTGKAIIEANIALAKKLDLKTVAEGVETIEEWKLLQEAGCDMAQGYFVAKAMPENDLENWHERWKKQIKQLNAYSD